MAAAGTSLQAGGKCILPTSSVSGLPASLWQREKNLVESKLLKNCLGSKCDFQANIRDVLLDFREVHHSSDMYFLTVVNWY